MVIISDTSPISNLVQVQKLNILQQLFQKIIIPPYVDKEIKELSKFGINLDEYLNADWIEIHYPSNLEFVRKLEEELDKGESQAIAIYKELEAELLIIDERLGSKIAKNHGVETIGLVGCLIAAKRQQIINLVIPLIDELEEIAGFYIGDKLRKKILEIVQE